MKPNKFPKKDSRESFNEMAKSIAKDVVKQNRRTSSGSKGKPPTRDKPGNSSSRPVDMSGELAQFVQEAIKKDQVVIFSKTYCPYCTMAKDVFKKMEKPFTVIELDKRTDGNNIQDILSEITGARTVPRVFLNGECIGGGSDVQALYDSGQLQTMIVSKM